MLQPAARERAVLRIRGVGRHGRVVWLVDIVPLVAIMGGLFLGQASWGCPGVCCELSPADVGEILNIRHAATGVEVGYQLAGM